MITLIGVIGLVMIMVAYFQRRRSTLHFILAAASAVLGVYSYLRLDYVFVVLNIAMLAVNSWQGFRYLRRGRVSHND
jgi:hypothetical protein